MTRDYEALAAAVLAQCDYGDITAIRRANIVEAIEDWLRAGDLSDNPTIEDLAHEWMEYEDF